MQCCLQAELKEGKQEVQRLKATLLEQEAAVLQRDRQLADLRKELKEALRRAEPPMQRDQAVQSILVTLQEQQTQVSVQCSEHVTSVWLPACLSALHAFACCASGFLNDFFKTW